MDTANVEAAIIKVGPESHPEQIAEALMMLNSMKERTRALEKQFKDAMAEVVRERGLVEVLGISYWLDYDKEVVCIDKAATLDTCMTLAKGDYEAAARDYMVAKPFKYGSIRKALDNDDRYAELFQTVEKKVLKDNSAKVRKLQSADTKYLR